MFLANCSSEELVGYTTGSTVNFLCLSFSICEVGVTNQTTVRTARGGRPAEDSLYFIGLCLRCSSIVSLSILSRCYSGRRGWNFVFCLEGLMTQDSPTALPIAGNLDHLDERF